MIKLRWKRLAMADLKEVLVLDPKNRGVQFVRATIGMGLLARSDGQNAKAIALLQEALQGAEEEGLNILKGRAERALTTLGVDISRP